MKMAGEGIFFDLQRGKFSGLDSEIKDYLEPALSRKASFSSSQLSTYSFYAVKFLHGYTTALDVVPRSSLAGILDALRVCYHCCRLQAVELKKALTIEKLLCHLLNKIIKRGMLASVATFAEFLHCDLQKVFKLHTKEVHNLAYGAFATIWNSTLQKSSDVPLDPWLCLKLRRAAIQLLCLSNKDQSVIMERITGTVERAELMVNQLRKTEDILKYSETMADFVTGMMLNLSVRTESHIETILYSCVEVYLRLLKCFFVNYKKAFPTAVRSLKELLTEVSRSCDCSTCQQAFQTTQICQDLFSVGYNMLCHLQQTLSASANNKNNKKTKSAGDFCGVLARCNQSLSKTLGSTSSLRMTKLLAESVDFCLSCLEKDPKSSKSSSTYISKLLAFNTDTQLEVLHLHDNLVALLSAESGLWKTERVKGEVSVEYKRRVHYLHQEMVTTLVNKQTLVLLRLQKDEDTSEKVLKAELEGCTTDVKSLVEKVENGIEDPDVPISVENRPYVAGIVAKLGRLAYLKTLYSEASIFLDIACQQLRKYARKHPDSDVQNLWKRHEFLAETHRKASQTEAAMTVIADGLLVAPGQLTSAVEFWAKLKADILKSATESPDHLLERTLWDQLKLQGTPSKLTPANVLQAEIIAYKLHRVCIPDAHLVAAQQLLQYSKEGASVCDTAFALLEKAQVLWVTRRAGKSQLEKLCQDAVDVLEKQRSKKSPKDGSTNTLCDDLALAYIWLYVTQDRDPLEVQKKRAKGKKASERPSPPTSDTEDVETFESCASVGVEQVLLEPLVTAVGLWEEALEKTNGMDSIRNSHNTLAGLNMVAAIFRLANKVTDMHRALQLVARVAMATGSNQQFLVAETQLAQSFLQLKQPHLADTIITESEAFLKSIKSDKLTQGATYIQLLLAKTETLFLKNQISQSHQTLSEAKRLQSASIKYKTIDWMTLEGSIKLLEAKFAALPPRLLQSAPPGESSLELLAKGVRSISGVVCFLLGDWLIGASESKATKAPDNTSDKWAVLDQMLDILLETGALYVQIGEAREARCYLQQGVKISQAFHLPRRFAQFHLTLSRLNMMAAKYADCDAHLHRTRYVLTLEGTNAIQNNSKTSMKKINYKLKIDRFGLEEAKEESGNENSDSDDFIKSKPIDFLNVVSQEVRGCESPRSRVRHEVEFPKEWDHSESCNCEHCADVWLQGALLRHYSAQARLQAEQGSTQEADRVYDALLRKFNSITARAQNVVEKLAAGALETQAKQRRNKTGFDQSLQSNPSVFQHTLVEICIQLATLGLEKSNREQFAEWIAKAQDLMDIEKYTWMSGCESDLAHVAYLQSLSLLPWPEALPGDQDEHLDKLVTKLSFMKVSASGATDFKTPYTGQPNSTGQTNLVKARPTKNVSALTYKREPKTKSNLSKSTQRSKFLDSSKPNRSLSASCVKQPDTFSVPSPLSSEKRRSNSLTCPPDDDRLTSNFKQGHSVSKPTSKLTKTTSKTTRCKDVVIIKTAKVVDLTTTTDGTQAGMSDRSLQDRLKSTSAKTPVVTIEPETPDKTRVKTTVRSQAQRPQPARNTTRKTRKGSSIPVYQDLFNSDSSDCKTPEPLLAKTPSMSKKKSEFFTPGCSALFTPQAVGNRKTVLDWLMESDSDDNIVKCSKSSKRKERNAKVTQGQKAKENPSSRRAKNSKNVSSSRVLVDAVVASPATQLLKPGVLLEANANSPVRISPKPGILSPAMSLFRSALKKTSAKENSPRLNTFEFVCSDSESVAQKKTIRSKKPSGAKAKRGTSMKQKGKQKKSADIEMEREAEDETAKQSILAGFESHKQKESVFDFDDPDTDTDTNKKTDKQSVKAEKHNNVRSRQRERNAAPTTNTRGSCNSEPQPESQPNTSKTKRRTAAKQAGRAPKTTRLTRSKTSTTETQRATDLEETEDIFRMGLEVSLCEADDECDGAEDFNVSVEPPGDYSYGTLLTRCGQTDEISQHQSEKPRDVVKAKRWVEVDSDVCLAVQSDYSFNMADNGILGPRTPVAKQLGLDPKETTVEADQHSGLPVFESPVCKLVEDKSDNGQSTADCCLMPRSNGGQPDLLKNRHFFRGHDPSRVKTSSLDSSIEIPRGGSDSDSEGAKLISKPKSRIGKRPGKPKKVGSRKGSEGETEKPRTSKVKVRGQLERPSSTPQKITENCRRSVFGEEVCVSKARDYLLQAFDRICHNPPLLVYRSVCQSLAMLALDSGSPWQAAYYLGEAQGLTFRHTLLSNISRKIRKMDKSSKSSKRKERNAKVTQGQKAKENPSSRRAKNSKNVSSSRVLVDAVVASPATQLLKPGVLLEANANSPVRISPKPGILSPAMSLFRSALKKTSAKENSPRLNTFEFVCSDSESVAQKKTIRSKKPSGAKAKRGTSMKQKGKQKKSADIEMEREAEDETAKQSILAGFESHKQKESVFDFDDPDTDTDTNKKTDKQSVKAEKHNNVRSRQRERNAAPTTNTRGSCNSEPQPESQPNTSKTKRRTAAKQAGRAPKTTRLTRSKTSTTETQRATDLEETEDIFRMGLEVSLCEADDECDGAEDFNVSVEPPGDYSYGTLLTRCGQTDEISQHQSEKPRDVVKAKRWVEVDSDVCLAVQSDYSFNMADNGILGPRTPVAKQLGLDPKETTVEADQHSGLPVFESPVCKLVEDKSDNGQSTADCCLMPRSNGGQPDLLKNRHFFRGHDPSRVKTSSLDSSIEIPRGGSDSDVAINLNPSFGLHNISRKMDKREEGEIERLSSDLQDLQLTSSSGHRDRLEVMRKNLEFNKSAEQLREVVSSLPEDWTVVQLSVIAPLAHPSGQLVMTRMSSQGDPLCVKIDGLATPEGQALLAEFAAVMRTSKDTMALTDRVEWWAQRGSLDEQCKEVLDKMEGLYVGEWRGMLLGAPSSEEDRNQLDRAAVDLENLMTLKEGTRHKQLLKVLVGSCHLLSHRGLVKAFHAILKDASDEVQFAEFIEAVQKTSKRLNLETSTRNPVVLILDKSLQHLPWESLDTLRGHPVTRVPSLHFLYAHLTLHRADGRSVYNAKVDTDRAYYILDPEDNLPNTQELFARSFSTMTNWKGVSGQMPTSDQYIQAITQHDLFIYCGHGNGSKFLSGDTLQMLDARATVLLMGCSSGKLLAEGDLDPSGMMLHYFLAGCPCIVANLWDVTDKDIDRFLQELLQQWLAAEPDTSLLSCIKQSRDACKFPFLVGAAPVAYGLPVAKR